MGFYKDGFNSLIDKKLLFAKNNLILKICEIK